MSICEPPGWLSFAASIPWSSSTSDEASDEFIGDKNIEARRVGTKMFARCIGCSEALRLIITFLCRNAYKSSRLFRLIIIDDVLSRFKPKFLNTRVTERVTLEKDTKRKTFNIENG